MTFSFEYGDLKIFYDFQFNLGFIKYKEITKVIKDKVVRNTTLLYYNNITPNNTLFNIVNITDLRYYLNISNNKLLFFNKLISEENKELLDELFTVLDYDTKNTVLKLIEIKYGLTFKEKHFTHGK